MSGVASDAMIEAAAKIIARHCSGRWWAAYNDQGRADKIAQARIPAAEVLRLLPSEAEIRADERAKIAAEIEKSADVHHFCGAGKSSIGRAFLKGLRRAARIAAGSSSPGAQEQQG